MKYMKALSEKVFLKLDMPNSKDRKSDRDRNMYNLRYFWCGINSCKIPEQNGG